MELRTKEVPDPPTKEAQKPAAEPPKPAPALQPVRKPVQSAENTPRKGSVPQKK